MKILKLITNTIKLKIIPILSHPLSLLILSSFIFSSMIAQYNNISSRNLAVINIGLIPAGKAYFDCRADIQTAQDYYYSIHTNLLSANNKNPTNNMVTFSSNVQRNILESNALDRKIQLDCSTIYEILNFQASLLNLQKDFKEIIKKREQRTYSAKVEQAKLKILLSQLGSGAYSSSLKENYDEYDKLIIELQTLEIRNYIFETNLYLQATHLFEKKLEENMNKKIWKFLL